MDSIDDASELDEVIDRERKILHLYPAGHPDRCTTLVLLASHLYTRFQQLGSINDLNEAIDFCQGALLLCPPGHPDRSIPLNNLAFYFITRYQQLGGIDDLNKAVDFCRGALSLCPPGHQDRSTCLNNLAMDLSSRYNQFGGMDDLNEAIDLSRDALSLCPPGNLDRSTCLNNFALHLSTRYKQLGLIDDLNEAIDLCREALACCLPGHPDQSTSLNNLAMYLSTRYNQFGGMNDLNEAIDLCRGALSLRPSGHPGRSTSLNNLAGYLSTRYNQFGGIDDLDEAIDLGRDALLFCLPGHPGRSTYLCNLAGCLSTRYKRYGRMDDLNEAIYLCRDALSHCPSGHPDRSASLYNLALHLSTRYNQLGGTDDLNEGIDLSRDALLLRPPGHPERSTSLNHLAMYLYTRFKQSGRADDLNEAVDLGRGTLSLCPPGHPDRSTSLNDLAMYLSTRYNQFEGIYDLNEAIYLGQEALSLRPPGHPDRSMSFNNLAFYFSARYKRFGWIDDLDRAIDLGRDALSLRPLGHLDWSTYLNNLALDLSTRYQQSGEMDDKQALFNLYTQLQHVSNTPTANDLNATKEWIDAAEIFHHPTTMLAYETALRLLVEHTAVLPSLPQHLAIIKFLSSSLAVDAFSACLRNQSPTKAVELLEQGRGVFWSQLTRLRSPLDDVISSGPTGKELANEYMSLTSLIRTVLHSPGADQHDRVCGLNLELQQVISKIRMLPDFSRFLLPSLFSDLRCAASDGPVIIMNASKYGCDALVMFVDKDPVHIPLPIKKKDIQEMSSNLSDLAKRAKKADVTRDFYVFLRDLWDGVVCHILDELQTMCPQGSRIWWCPTAEFSLLPLHAASPYRKGQKGVSDLYISSYTTTLTSLIRARRPRSADPPKKRFVAIGQAQAKGAGELLSVSEELDNIGWLVDGLATFKRIEGESACISTFADELSKNEWVHFACHGIPNPEQPFKSAFALRDGRFTIQQIIQCDLQNPEFAYLSACHTTVGDRQSPDEVIHLASAMQFAGFRSVIGTMWAVDDSETNKIISAFYEHIVDESGQLDYTRAAFALRKALKSVKTIPMDQRTLYIHLGA